MSRPCSKKNNDSITVSRLVSNASRGPSESINFRCGQVCTHLRALARIEDIRSNGGSVSVFGTAGRQLVCYLRLNLRGAYQTTFAVNSPEMPNSLDCSMMGLCGADRNRLFTSVEKNVDLAG